MTPFDGLGLIVCSRAATDARLPRYSRRAPSPTPLPMPPLVTVLSHVCHRPRCRPRPRRGATLVEQLWLLALTGGVASLAIASGGPLFAALDVAMATQETVDLLALARDHAIASGERTAVRFDVPGTRVIVHVAHDTIAVGDFHGSGLTLEATRDSLSYAPTGLGVGAANLRLVLTRSARADTITVSRLGRVQRR
jgi:hypothetical protein